MKFMTNFLIVYWKEKPIITSREEGMGARAAFSVLRGNRRV